MADGRVESFDGDLDEYAAWLSARANKSAEVAREPAAPPSPPVAAKGLQARRQAEGQARMPQAARRQQQLARLEEKMESVAAELATAGRAAGGAGGVRRTRPGNWPSSTSRHAAVREAHEALEAEWLSLYGQLAGGLRQACPGGSSGPYFRSERRSRLLARRLPPGMDGAKPPNVPQPDRRSSRSRRSPWWL